MVALRAGAEDTGDDLFWRIVMRRVVPAWCGVVALVCGSVAVVAQSGVSSGVGMGVIAGPVGIGIKGQPFALKERITSVRTLGDGTSDTSVREEHSMRDAEGRTRLEKGQLKDGVFEPEVVILNDPIARMTTTLVLRDRTANVVHYAEPRMRGARVERSPEEAARLGEMQEKAREERADILHRPEPPTVEKLSAQTIAGVFAEGTRTTRVISEGSDRPVTVVSERWFSPELKIVMGETTDDPRSGKTTVEVTELVRSNPDAGLFQIPQDFKLVGQDAGDAAR